MAAIYRVMADMEKVTKSPISETIENRAETIAETLLLSRVKKFAIPPVGNGIDKITKVIINPKNNESSVVVSFSFVLGANESTVCCNLSIFECKSSSFIFLFLRDFSVKVIDCPF